MTNLKEKLFRTRQTVKSRIDELLSSKKNREEILDDLMETLILADIGVSTGERIIEHLRENSKKTDSQQGIRSLLRQEIVSILSQHPVTTALNQPQSVAMFVGINGGGKTTSLAKLARFFQADGKQVMMVAADTFRAAAQEQLSIWGKRLNIPVVRGQYGADPASVTYDALQSFQARQFDLLLIDTAGRVHTNANLMSELEKIQKIVSREIEQAPQEVFLVLDASIGQNALIQAREFLKFSAITGIFLSKLDGTAKGGCALSIVDELRLPIKFIGTGEGDSDILPFSPQEFADALIS
ncbi:MAG: signal recognition particle-docking protein FtsY [Candidatus Aminicenantaceae bacterium]